ncbi:MAG: prolyl-tRNA synthetase associated domain-containing protein [Methyloceanibacter sp.]|nr:prolyl-tRNA synthetase associated domain-containing protein [Methyloceanibacter sp.]
MELAREKLLAYLDQLGIASETVEHEPLFTVEQSKALRGVIPGAHTKNLFLRDKDGRFVLVVAKEDTKVDLKGLAKQLGCGRFSFGKPEQMLVVLGVEPGSVTALALMHDGSSALSAVVIDEALMAHREVNCHPLDNRATTRLSIADLLLFMRACGHEPIILPLA